MPFETPTMHREEIDGGTENLSNIEKRNLRRFWDRIIDEGMDRISGRIDKLGESKRFSIKDYPVIDLFSSIDHLIELCEREDSLESRNKKMVRNLRQYNEFKETLQRFQEETKEFHKLLKDNISLMDKDYLRDQYETFKKGSFMKLQKLAEEIAPKDGSKESVEA